MNKQPTTGIHDTPAIPRSRSGSRTNWWIMFGIIGIVVLFTLLPMIKAWQSVGAFEREAREAGLHHERRSLTGCGREDHEPDIPAWL